LWQPNVDIGAEGDAIRIEAGLLAGLPGERDAPGQPLDIGAEG